MCFVAEVDVVANRLRRLADKLNRSYMDMPEAEREELGQDIVWCYIELDGVIGRRVSLLEPTALRVEIVPDYDAIVHSLPEVER